MNWIDQHIEQDPFLAGKQITRYSNWVSAKISKTERMYKVVAARPINYYDGREWKGIDTTILKSHSGWGVPYMDFRYQQGAEHFLGHAWEPVRFGGYQDGKFYPAGQISAPILHGDKLFRAARPFEYWTQVGAANVKGEMWLHQLPDIRERYFAVEYKSDSQFAKDYG